jgi:uncharacterized membrane protein
VGAVGAALILGHNAFDGVRPEQLGPFGTAWAFLHVSGAREVLGVKLFLLYPLVPWVGVIAAGYAFGVLYQLPSRKRRRWLVGLGTGLVLVFIPPSLAYVAMTLGPALLVLAAVERARGVLSRAFVTLGRVPLFFYVLHIALVHAMALALGVVEGHPASAFARDFLHRPDGFGFGLVVVYAAWLAALALLYPPSRWFAGVKQRSRSAWLSYL